MAAPAFVAAVHAAGVCEVAWLRTDGSLDVAAATPLVLDDRPALALPYAYAELGRDVGTADQVAVVLSDSRLSGSSWRPIAMLGRPELTEDRDGGVFTEHLLDQELRKFPPARVLADSPILRREHWWYLPRLIVTVEPEAVVDVAERAGGAADGVLAVAVSGVAAQTRLAVASVEVERRDDRAVQVRRREMAADAAGSALATGTSRAVVVCHDFSPDMERWTSWTAHGVLGGDLSLAVDHEAGDVELPRPLSLMARMRRQRDLARACRRGI
ncbi:hypothetical protein [Haloactinopolyspora sp.]|uniref:hypothetical protein n=1 Tax=Haloactinopolyspora sp. TaxID=1966353 RepID=UPI0026378B2E|nr:hypothetical protein [Haloactinopolyspora sp.]